MFDKAQIEAWFTFPDEEVVDPRLSEFDAALLTCDAKVQEMVRPHVDRDAFLAELMDPGNPFHVLGSEINRICPDSADKSAAIRCLRLAHMAFSKALTHIRDVNLLGAEMDNPKMSQQEHAMKLQQYDELIIRGDASLRLYSDQLYLASMQAKASIFLAKSGSYEH